MNRHFSFSISALVMSAMIMSGVIVTAISLTVIPAFSKSDNANSRSNNGSGNSNTARENANNSNGQGATASSLGALNAAHANAIALENATAYSRVGMIAIYKTAVGITADAKLAYDTFIIECGDDGSELDNVVDNDDGTLELVPYCDYLLGNASSVAGGESFTTETYIAFLAGKIGMAQNFEDTALLAAANKVTDELIIEALWDILDISIIEPTDPVE